jgi:hypothetical protein
LHLSADHALDQPDIGLMRRVATAEFLAGGITLFLVLLAPDPDKTDHAAVAIVGGLILLAAALLAHAGGRACGWCAWRRSTPRPRSARSWP